MFRCSRLSHTTLISSARCLNQKMEIIVSLLWLIDSLQDFSCMLTQNTRPLQKWPSFSWMKYATRLEAGRGIPLSVISDNDKLFTAKFFKSMFERLGSMFACDWFVAWLHPHKVLFASQVRHDIEFMNASGCDKFLLRKGLTLQLSPYVMNLPTGFYTQ